MLSVALTAPVFAQTIPSSQLLQGLYIKEGDSLQWQMTSIVGDVPNSMGVICETLDDPKCLAAPVNQQAMKAFLLPCSNSVTVGCIEEVYARDENGKKYSAEFSRVIAPKLNFGTSTFSEDKSTKMVAGSGVGNLWTLTGLPNEVEPLNLVVQSVLWGSRPVPGGSLWNYWSAELGIAPVRLVYGNYRANGLEFDSQTKRITGGDTIGSNGRPDDTCAATEAGICFDRITFPKNYRFGINVRIPQPLVGFFHGRINSPTISQVISKSGSANLIINADPVQVPFLRERITYPFWTQEMIDFADKNYFCPDNLRCGGTGGGLMYPGVSGSFSFDVASRFLPIVKDKATGTGDFWGVRTLSGSSEDGGNSIVRQCISNRTDVAGIVTTNAMVYSAGPPAFNATTGALDYKVLSPHFNSTGGENTGTYDLLLRSDFARCLYGFSNAPIRAEISILGSTGEEKVATTSIREEAGWLYLSAKGFTYSAPVVRVKMAQDKPVEQSAKKEEEKKEEAAPSSKVVKKVVAKKSITCTKGKITKKVTGTNPKCPTGYKKR